MTGSHIGILKNEADQLAIGKIGYVIGEKYQRKGCAGEALLCLLKVYLKDRLEKLCGDETAVVKYKGVGEGWHKV